VELLLSRAREIPDEEIKELLAAHVHDGKGN
jgi:hypothetical protein